MTVEPPITSSTDLLAGVRVLDLSRYLPGPACALHLSWLGAQVTCIEQPPHGDPMRGIPPVDPATGESLAYSSLRRAARRELLDLSDPAGRTRALKLAAEADVVIESFRPGVAERLGVGPAALRERDPALVYCSISGFGQDGPWVNAPGHDLGYEAMAGLAARSGTPERVVAPAVPVADLAGALTAAAAICAALVRRARTGAGCHLDIALSEAALALQLMDLPAADRPEAARGSGPLTGALACYDAYECADGEWVAVAPIEPKFFATLCEQLDLGYLVPDQFDPAAQSRIRAELAAAFAQRSARAWDRELAGDDGGGACVVWARPLDQVAAHPQFIARGAVERATFADGAPLPASPYVVDGARTSAPVQPPSGQL